MVPNEALLKIVEKLKVMKPNSVDKDNLKQQIKLDALLESKEYIAEDKIDGCHYMAVAAHFFSTELVEKTNNYPHLALFFENLNMPNLILDGEVNYPGKTSQYCTRVTGADPSTAIAFQKTNGLIHYTFWDMLRTPKGTWLTNEPLYKRRKMVEYFYEHYIVGTPMEEFIHITKWIEDGKRQFRDDIWERGEEGIVLKRKDSIYVMGKKPAWMWMKMKNEDTVDLFISGYDPPKVEYSGTAFDTWPYWRDINGVSVPVSKFYYMDWIGAIELSAYVDGKATKICTCAGIDETLRKNLSDNPDGYLNRVVKISYMEKTEAGYPRHPRFEDFHESKLAEECTWQFN